MAKYKIFDTHAHYDSDDFDNDREELIQEMMENGVIGILNCASSADSLDKTNKLTLDHEIFIGALGIHPENADEFNEEIKEKIKEKIKENDKIVAIGEIGLDYYWDENPSKEVQKEAFIEQMKLAEELNLPVIIHDREAHADTLEIIKMFPKVRGIVHCFSGSKEFAMQCIKEGYYIGVTGVVTFKNAKKVKEVVKAVPVDRLLVETDAPFMAPEPNRGKRNKSDYILHIIEQIAEIKEFDPIELNIQLNKNFKDLLNQGK